MQNTQSIGMSVFNYTITPAAVQQLITAVGYDGRTVINRLVTAKVERCQGFTAADLNAAGTTGLGVKDGVLYNPYGLFLSNKYGGKMSDIVGLTGFAGNCADCLKRAENPKNVCSICFSLIGSRFVNLKAWTKNDVILSTVKFTLGDLVLDPTLIPELRYGTHSDLINALYAYNLFVIAETNPGTEFPLWLKNHKYYKAGLEMFSAEHGEKPANLRSIYSGHQLDVYPSESSLRALKSVGYDAYFCVYSTLDKQQKAVDAGAHRCLCADGSCKYGCHFCYDHYTVWSGTGSDKAVWIAEILNGDRHKE